MLYVSLYPVKRNARSLSAIIYLNQLSGVVQGSLLANLVHEGGLWVGVHFCWYMIFFLRSFFIIAIEI